MGAKIGIIGSSVLLKSGLLKCATEKKVKTRFGTVSLFIKDDITLILRHEKKNNIPPHKINHKANITALKKNKVKYILGINSVGSMKKSIKPGAIIIPDDYINLRDIETFYDNKIIHVTPEISKKLRQVIISAAKNLNIKVFKKGIYLQTIGPRLETKAEIQFLKNYADIVGMTAASEATLAKEIGIEYATISTVDNYANGIGKNSLSNQNIIKQRNKNFIKTESLIKNIMEIAR